MLRAAGDPARFALLELLASGALCVTDLATLTGDPMPSVSQRLRLLRTDGLVRARREGKHVFYALADGHVRTLLRNILLHAAETPEHGASDAGEQPQVPVGPSTPRVPPSVDPSQDLP